MANQKTETKKITARRQNTSKPRKGATNSGKENERVYDLSKWSDLKEFVSNQKISERKTQVARAARGHIEKRIRETGLGNFNILFLYQEDEDSIESQTLDTIYSRLAVLDRTKKLILILHSTGGRIEPAYFISKSCTDYSSQFVVTVPRKAKSAATLISLGAHEIHMGSISELGPIDPQIGGLPVLALGNALDVLASIATKYPKASDMFAAFLSNKLDLQHLGYYERVADSAIAYGTRLLGNKSLPRSPEEIATSLVKDYKDHSFVIDKSEATELLGSMIQLDTSEYKFANEIVEFLSDIKLALWFCDPQHKDYSINLIGDYTDLYILSKKSN